MLSRALVYLALCSFHKVERGRVARKKGEGTYFVASKISSNFFFSAAGSARGQ